MSLINLASLLKRFPVFSNIDEPTLESIAVASIKLEVARLNTLTQHYSPNKYAFFVITGHVGTVTHTDCGKRFVVQAYGPGDLTDVGDLFIDRPCTQEVMSLVRSTVIALPKNKLKEVMLSKKSILMDFALSATRQARQQQTDYISFGQLTTTTRIKNYLVEKSHVVADGTLVYDKQVGYATIGQILGCSREMVQNVVRKLKEADYLIETKSSIYLSDKLTVETDIGNLFSR